jgi:isopentenyl phosphate kinase
METELIFVKLGGSLITDKHQRATPRHSVIQRLADEVDHALTATPGLRVLLGHGSGSFGHWVADQYQTQNGVDSREAWHGFAEVSAEAGRLNRLVVDTFLKSGVPVMSLQPSSAVHAHAGEIRTYPLETLELALDHQLVPLIYGDVAFDTAKGGTILSTEALFTYIAARLRPAWILLLGNAPGVLDAQGRVIPTITPATYARVQAYLSGSSATDVTGGMADKVSRMMELTQDHPDIRIRILSGRTPNTLVRALLNPDTASGTLIHAGPSTSRRSDRSPSQRDE